MERLVNGNRVGTEIPSFWEVEFRVLVAPQLKNQLGIIARGGNRRDCGCGSWVAPSFKNRKVQP